MYNSITMKMKNTAKLLLISGAIFALGLTSTSCKSKKETVKQAVKLKSSFHVLDLITSPTKNTSVPMQSAKAWIK